MDLSIHRVQRVVMEESRVLDSGSRATHIKIYGMEYIQGAERPVMFELTLFSDNELTIEGE